MVVSDGSASDFNYVIGEKDDLIVILFYGRITSKELPVLHTCATKLEEKTQSIFLFNFRDVTAFHSGVHPFFVNFQKRLRETGKFIGVCGLQPEVRAVLMSAGIVRDSELYYNIPEAWKAVTRRKQVA